MLVCTGKNNIDALHVKCTNSVGDTTCNWFGRFGDRKEHLARCTYAAIPCPNKCKDENNEVTKLTLEDHLEHCPNKVHVCPHCQKEADIAGVHDQTCPKKPVPCPNSECSCTVQRRGIKRHLEVCPYAETLCKYATLGCSVMMQRQAISTHEQDVQPHFHKAIEAVMELRSLEKRRGIKLRSGESVTFKLTKYLQKKESTERFDSPSFSTSCGHHLVVQIHVNGSGNNHQHLSVSTQLTQSDNEVGPFNGKITIKLLNQLEDDNHHSKTGRSLPKFIHNSKLSLNAANKRQYLKDDTLYFRVTVDTPDIKPWLE